MLNDLSKSSFLLRIGLSTICLMLCALPPAQNVEAADASHFANIGFSPDGKYYAFEEFGVQDGSGFLYSSIYILDTHSDVWVKPSPLHLQQEEDLGNLNGLRESARAQIYRKLDTLGITESGDHLVSRKLADRTLDNKDIRFVPHTGQAIHNFGDKISLSLDLKPLPSTAEYCDENDPQTQGFRLRLNGIEIHEDMRISASRGCPYDYEISEIFNHNGQFVALISVRKRGFEGLDRRFIAVPFRAE